MWRVLVLTLVPALGAAAEKRSLGPDAPRSAEVRYQTALKHYRAGEYAEAAQEFLVAYQLHPEPRLAFNLARSLERSARPAEAIEAYEDYLRAAPEAEDHAEVQKVIAALRLVVNRGYPTLEITSTPKGLPVRVDGEPAEGATPLTVRVKPGVHRVEVGEGEQRTATQAKVVANHPNSVHLTLAEAETQTRPSAFGVWPWVALGVGVVGVGAAAAFGLSAEADEAERDKLEDTDLMAAEAAHESAQEQATLAWVGVGVGVAGLGAGLALLLLDDSGEATVTVGPGYAAVGGRF